MVVMADCETELELNGLKIPITLAVVENLGYDLIIGMERITTNTSSIRRRDEHLDVV
jgi:hypothetical protein